MTTQKQKKKSKIVHKVYGEIFFVNIIDTYVQNGYRFFFENSFLRVVPAVVSCTDWSQHKLRPSRRKEKWRNKDSGNVWWLPVVCLIGCSNKMAAGRGTRARIVLLPLTSLTLAPKMHPATVKKYTYFYIMKSYWEISSKQTLCESKKQTIK